uniref:Diguanylate phosphodiesterase n=1 Tax=Rhodopseudomonas palustris (strain BisA53) TaxID=316055 RepID=Q07T62_RHOP5
MIRISTIFIAICMVLVSASLGMVLYSMARFSFGESAIVALAVLTFLVLYNLVSKRLGDRADASQQIVDLSNGTADLARQVAEFGRRLAVLESKAGVADAHAAAHARANGPDQVQLVLSEIGELGAVVRQLANTVATHEDLLALAPPPAAAPAVRAPRASAPPLSAPLVIPPATPTVPPPPAVAVPAMAAAPLAVAGPDPLLVDAVKAAVEANRIDLYLQPIVTLPQRKVRFYEAVTRLRDGNDKVLTADTFIAAAETAGLIGRIDHALILRCMQVLRRLLVRNKDVGIFCNIAAATLRNPETFAQCLDFLEANRAMASSFVIEFKQGAFRSFGPVEIEHVAALAQRGYRFSIDHVTDLRIEPRELADRGVRFLKVPASLLLGQSEGAPSHIHPQDLSDLLGRYGIDLIAERIEGERAVVDLLDFDVRFGQGFLFSAPRPLRPDAAAANGQSAPGTPSQANNDASKVLQADAVRADPPRATGNAALARRAAGPY